MAESYYKPEQQEERVFGANKRVVQNGPEAIALVRDAVRNNFRYPVFSETSVMVQCPFHKSDTGWSRTLAINIKPKTNERGKPIPVGLWHCWSCGKAGEWNTLAEERGLPLLSSSDNYRVDTVAKHVTYETPYFKPTSGLKPLPDNWVWKRKDTPVDYKTLRSFGARQWTFLARRTNKKETRLWLPSHENNELVGHVAAALHGEEPKYLNSKGAWALSHFLFYDEARAMAEKWRSAGYSKRFCVVTEGPGDAAVLLQKKIPAVACLGAGNFTATKANLLAAFFDVVFACGDGDAPGKKFNKSVKDLTSGLVLVYKIRLPEGADPASLTTKQHKQLRDTIIDKITTKETGE